MDIVLNQMYTIPNSSNVIAAGMFESELGFEVMRVEYRGGLYEYWPVTVDEFKELFSGPDSFGSKLRVFVSGLSYRKIS
jgi:hypothetical protein